jgi:hypothetical protein
MPSKNSLAESFFSVGRLGRGKDAIIRKCEEAFITRFPNASAGGNTLPVGDQDFSDGHSSHNGSWQMVKSNSLCSLASSYGSSHGIRADIPMAAKKQQNLEKEELTMAAKKQQNLEKEEILKNLELHDQEMSAKKQRRLEQEEILKNLDLHDQEMAAKKKLDKEMPAIMAAKNKLNDLMKKHDEGHKVEEKTQQSTINEIAELPWQGADEHFDYAELDNVLEPGTYVPSSLTTIQHFLDDKSLPDFL